MTVAFTRRSKFNAVKVALDGHTFDSKVEAKRYGDLKLLEKAKEISSLRVHPAFDISIRGYLIATYKADFTYLDKAGRFHCEDVKSAPTAAKRDFVLIRKLMRAVNGVEIEIVGVKPGKTSSRPSMRADAERA
jgi:hypothetical protein